MQIGEGIFWYINYTLNYPDVKEKIQDVTESDKFKDFQPFLLNRLFSHHRDLRVKEISFFLNKYIYNFYRYKDLLLRIYCNCTPTLPGIQFIKYNKRADEKGDIYSEELINTAKKVYGGYYSKKEIIEILNFLRLNLRDEFFMICKNSGIDLKKLKKYFPEKDFSNEKIDKKTINKANKEFNEIKRERKSKVLDDLL